MATTPRHRHDQSGTALAVGLILLVVMTLLSVAGIRGTTMQERMASNLRDRNLAFQSAESALRAAEQVLASGGGSSAERVPTAGSIDFWNACWGDSGTVPEDCPPVTVHTIDLAQWGLAAAPSYRIERLRGGTFGSMASDEALATAPMYRITARGVGGTADSVVIIQSTYRP